MNPTTDTANNKTKTSKENTTQMGMNKTGIQMSPLMSKEMEEEARTIGADSQGNTDEIFRFRTTYIEESQSLGTVPIPGTIKGVAQTVLQKLKGEKPEVFVDKLGERLAFERTGVRLYDALINKCQSTRLQNPLVSVETLKQFRNEEYEHFNIIKNSLEQLGADPTCQTPSADSNAVLSGGFIQVLNDPRTTISQCIQAILVAELADNDAWEMLIKLASDLELENMVVEFKRAHTQEEKHLQTIRALHKQLVVHELN